MSRDVDKPSLDEMQIAKRELPAAPIPISNGLNPAPEPAEIATGVNPAPAYVPATPNREPLVSWSCRLPLRLRDMLEDKAKEYGTDMTSIVVDLLEIHLPKIPRKKR